MADDSRCPECHSSNLKVESIRAIKRKRRKGQPPDNGSTPAQKVEVSCRRCGWSGSILRRVDPAE